MATTGTVKTLYNDEAHTTATFPRTVFSAVSNTDGKTLESALAEKQAKLPEYIEDKVLHTYKDGDGNIQLEWASGGNVNDVKVNNVSFVNDNSANILTDSSLTVVEGSVPNKGDIITMELVNRTGTGYESVDYIQVDGQEYINTSIVPNSDWTIEFKFARLDMMSANSTLWCARGNDYTDNTNSAFLIGTNKIRSDYYNNNRPDTYEINDIDTHILKRAKNEVYVDDTLVYTNEEVSFTAGGPMKLFASYVGDLELTVTNFAQIKCYYIKIYDADNNLIYDFEPVYNHNIGYYGLHETVNDVFYGNNATSGKFTSELEQYRILKLEGTQAEVVALYERPVTAFGDGTTTVVEGKTVQKYEASLLDSALATTFYNELNSNAKAALINTIRPIEAFDSEGTKFYSGDNLLRYIYTPTVQDLLDYTGASFDTLASGGADAGLWTMLWDTSSAVSSRDIWLCDAYTEESTYAFIVSSADGALNADEYSSNFAVKPMFTIDLSKIDAYKQIGTKVEFTHLTVTNPVTEAEKAVWDDKTTVTASAINGHINIDGEDTPVYVLPSSIKAITVNATTGVSDGTNTYKYTLPDNIKPITVSSSDGVSDGTNTYKYTLPDDIKAVSANPTTTTATLTGIKIGDTAYKVEGGSGGGNVDDVYVNGTSVVSNKIAYVDMTFSNDQPTTVDVGGIKKGTTFDNVPIKTLLNNMLYPLQGLVFTSLTGNVGGSYEYGSELTLSTVTPSFSIGSDPLNLVTVGTTEGGYDLYQGTTCTSGVALTLTTTKTYNGINGGEVYMTLSDGTTTVSKSISIDYNWYKYYTVSDSTTAPTSGTKQTSSDSAGVSISYSSGQYLWFYSKSSSTSIQTNVLGSWADVATTDAGSVTLTLENGSTSTYYVYRTNKFTGSGTAMYRLI